MSREFLYSIETCSLILTIAKPTRITDETAALSDNIFIKNPINDIFGIIINYISYHPPIIKMNSFNEIRKQENAIQYRIIN